MQYSHTLKENATIRRRRSGNKTDLEKERQVSPEEGAKFAKSFLADYHETSVKLNAGVDDTFTTIAKKIINKIS